jgi:hypothetical protein
MKTRHTHALLSSLIIGLFIITILNFRLQFDLERCRSEGVEVGVALEVARAHASSAIRQAIMRGTVQENGQLTPPEVPPGPRLAYAGSVDYL